MKSTMADVETAETLSVRRTFANKTVLITGATGFVGSLVLEQLLRVCPDVARVYVLARPKKNQSAAMRLQRLLANGIFNDLWDKADALSKIVIVQGDIGVDGLGIDIHDKERLISEVNFVIHAAADVALDDPIRLTLNSNYRGTQRLLEFCSGMKHIHSFCHVSTAYVNVTLPSGSTVLEAIYPLKHGDQTIDHEEVANELFEMSPESADNRASVYIDRFGFPNTYCFGKHLTEQLVNAWHRRVFPICIVRPSLVASVAGKPYPGYIGNLAGSSGFAISYAIGFFGPWAAAWVQKNVTDIIPADVVTSIILTATAATHVHYSKVKNMRNWMSNIISCLLGTQGTNLSRMFIHNEMCVYTREFLSNEPSPYCMLFGDYPEYPLDYIPNPWLVYLAKSMTFWKVCIMTKIARFMGKERIARRLEVGYRAWDVANSAVYDFNLFFSTKHVQQLNAMLVKEEKEDMMLLWTSQCMNWKAFFQLKLAGIKRLLLKTELRDPKGSLFRFIPPRSMESAIENKKEQ